MRKIKDVMTRDVEVIGPDATVEEAARRMRDGDFGMMPVGENDRMIGAISDRDIAVRGIAEGRDGNAKVRDVMSDGIRWAYEDEPLEHAAQIMAAHQIRRLPILDRGKRLVGILSLADVAMKQRATKPLTEAICGISQPVAA
ncbi:CBS domain-containing protein [uncultured Variovorax sp.]|uniref:CBS domain-containing protein n=1 Tax=uncultured Variovorax sp. TaxID=114708 RepID=UPI0025F5F267|nr:CBS domain-containing protein [uncultured Variovorax sp.]